MHFFDHRRGKLIVTISCAILLLWDIFFVLTPFVNKSIDLTDQIAAINKNIADLNKNIQAIDPLRADLGALKSREDAFAKGLLGPAESPALLENFKKIAEGAEVNIVSGAVLEKLPSSETKGPFREIPIEVKAEGGYHNLGKFLSGVESLDKIVRLKDMEIVQGSAAPGQQSAVFLFSAYSQNDKN